jgi:hypothetical protein
MRAIESQERSMHGNPPLSIVVLEVLKHTPYGVWAILALITLLGALQWRDQNLTRGRLLLAPIGLGAYALWSVSAQFGAAAAPVWLAGMALAFAVNRGLRWPRTVAVGSDGRFALPGSVWPLLLMWAIFALRYAVAVALVFHPARARDAAFGAGSAALYGLLSGLFAARAWRVVQSARPAPALQPA